MWWVQTKLSDTFTGKVVEVVSGDCLVIKDAASGQERRVQLSRCALGKEDPQDVRQAPSLGVCAFCLSP